MMADFFDWFLALYWWQYLLIAYVVGIPVCAMKTADDARENRDDDPVLALLPHSQRARIVMAVITILLSSIWPLFALGALLRPLAKRLAEKCRMWADRLREYADEDPLG